LLSKEDQTVSYLLNLPGLIQICPIQNTYGIGHVIAQFAVAPTAIYDLGLGRNEGELTPLGFCSMPYKWWTGTIKYDFEVIASVFHRCTIVILYEPWSVPPSGGLLAKLETNMHWTFSISGNSNFAVEIPWRNSRPWLKVPKPYSNAVLDSTQREECSNGNLTVYVLNPLVSNGSTDPIYLNIYHSGKDLKFGQVNTETTTFTLVYASKPYDNTMGEEPAHTMKELCNRSGLFTRMFSLDPGKLNMSFSFQNDVGLFTKTGTSTSGFPVDVAMNIMSYVSMAYVGTRGSITYTVTFPSGTQPLSFSASDYVETDLSTFTDSYDLRDPGESFGAFATTTPEIENNYSFTVPMYLPGYFRPTLNREDDTLGEKTNAFTVRATVSAIYANNTNYYNFYRQGGEDFELVGFRGFPRALWG